MSFYLNFRSIFSGDGVQSVESLLDEDPSQLVQYRAQVEMRLNNKLQEMGVDSALTRLTAEQLQVKMSRLKESRRRQDNVGHDIQN